MKKALFLLFLLPLSMLAQEMKIFKQDNYAIEYPLDWVMRESKNNPLTKFFLFPEAAFKKSFAENINLTMTEESDQIIAIEDLKAATTKDILSMTSSHTLLVDRIRKIKDRSVHELIMEGVLKAETDAKALAFRSISHTWIEGKRICVLTFICSQSEYQEDLSIPLQIMESFRFIEE